MRCSTHPAHGVSSRTSSAKCGCTRMCLMRMFVLPMSVFVTWRRPRLLPTLGSLGWRLPLVQSPPLLLPSCSDLKRARLDAPQVHMRVALQMRMHMTMLPTLKMGKQGMLNHVDQHLVTDMVMELGHHDVRYVTMMIRLDLLNLKCHHLMENMILIHISLGNKLLIRNLLALSILNTKGLGLLLVSSLIL